MASQTQFQRLHQKSQSSLALAPGSYIYSLCQSGADALAAISSDNSLRCFDRQTLHLLPDGVFKDVHPGRGGGVTCVREVHPTVSGGKNLIATSGRDGTVKVWDTRNARRDAVLTVTAEKAPPITALACGTEMSSIVAGTELVSSQASVIFWDIRSPNQARLQYVECHNDDITELQFHPTRSNVLLSGSTDGLVNIYDTTITDEDEALLQVVNHGSIHHAGFLGEDAIYALSHDEVFSIHPLNNPNENVAEPAAIQFGDLRPVLHNDYVVQVLDGRGGAFVASGKTSEQLLDITPLISSPQYQFDESNTWRLPGAHGEEVVRSVFLDDSSKTIFTCGEDGYVRSWKADESEVAPTETKSEEEQTLKHSKRSAPENEGRVKKKHGKEKKHKKERGFKPY
ncbi:hypothetical protein FQN50_003896 [Emmonsiellopsis sp. PD_5]|nr:hypothetical protein FQN50_003896 [Emmonsiellopsis sp. PD_5]